jgi:hypothetical protein
MKRVITVLAVALVVAAMLVAMAMPAFAKITPGSPGTPPSCENNGGQQPGGQQPTCTGGGLTQDPGTPPTPATNPSGHAPPGQQ